MFNDINENVCNYDCYSSTTETDESSLTESLLNNNNNNNNNSRFMKYVKNMCETLVNYIYTFLK